MNSILFVQHGDFRETYEHFASGGDETYRDQKRSVDFVSALAPENRVTTLVLGKETYTAELATNLWAIGREKRALNKTAISNLFDEVKPTHVVLRTPNVDFLKAARNHDCWVLPVFADILSNGGPRTNWRNFKLRRALLRTKSSCTANHSLNASMSLVSAIGLPADRVVPWDWSKVPVEPQAKDQVHNSQQPSAFFAGSITEDKGVGDCLDAVAALAKQGLALTLSIAGSGDVDGMKSRCESLGITDQVRFKGMISNADVRTEMRNHDFVLVPSRHSYPEGLPNVIYEALASRSVLVTSDHPAFRGRLEPDQECLIFEAANPKSLADCLRRAIQEPSLYKTISENSAQAHDSLYLGMDWSDLVERFLNDPADKTKWVQEHALASLLPASGTGEPTPASAKQQ